MTIISKRAKKLIEDAAYEIEQNTHIEGIYDKMISALESMYIRSLKKYYYKASRYEHLESIMHQDANKHIANVILKNAASAVSCVAFTNAIYENVKKVRHAIESTKKIPIKVGSGEITYASFYIAVYCAALDRVFSSGYFHKFFLSNIDEVMFKMYSSDGVPLAPNDIEVPSEMWEMLHRSEGFRRAFRRAATSYNRPYLQLLNYNTIVIGSSDAVKKIIAKVHTEKLKYLMIEALKKCRVIDEAHA